MKSKLPYILLIPFLLAGCNTTPKEEDNKYQSKTINVYYLNKEYNTTCDIRYYGKSVIPYISLKDYQQFLYRGRTYLEGRDKFDIKQDGKKYTITVAGDYTATFDVKENKMESSNLWAFKNTNYNYIGDKALVSYDGLPFTRVKSVSFDKPAKTTVIDFSKYNLKIYGDKNAVYVPVTFATDLFANENILQGAYNTKDLFIFNYTENEEVDTFGSLYYEPMFANPIEKEYVEYVYNELCLDYDFFLGRPGRSSLERYYDLSKGLDAALSNRPLGQKIKQYLTSTDVSSFLAGAALLGYLRQDGGHSYYRPGSTSVYRDPTTGEYKYPAWFTGKIYEEMYSIIDNEFAGNYEELINYDQQVSRHSSIYKARKEKLNKPNRVLKGQETYTKDGDIAYIHIEGFMGEIELQNEWNKYYKGERDTIPFGTDFGGAVGAINYGVKQAANDEQIKHVVIDLSANTGGSTDEMLFMIALLTGSKQFYAKNTMNDYYMTTTYEFDLNLDKVFDEKDDEMINLLKDKDISVLTSKSGFSCGGISPIYLHEEGLFTLGEECGGGSCSIYLQYDGFGGLNRASTPSHTVTKNKVSVDVARKTVCDSPLNIIEKQDGSYDYSALFDTASLRTLINEHYAK